MRLFIFMICLLSNSLSADFMDDTWRLKSFIYEMRSVSSEQCDLIESILPEDHIYSRSWQFNTGKMEAYDDVIMWLEYGGKPWTSD